ncbi:hypothetical protein Tcan_11429 [Toxocara canis]|uniref:Uncharacterized protein n=2 Tax=Toxocara canis TaxID=6265 RepID=A0A0B2VTF1_TOXCA|nr:hypothetical protein Tcan_11429 [Toxocara canis]VDM49012.1 unnamed protein product [Toxocara canis]
MQYLLLVLFASALLSLATPNERTTRQMRKTRLAANYHVMVPDFFQLFKLAIGAPEKEKSLMSSKTTTSPGITQITTFTTPVTWSALSQPIAASLSRKTSAIRKALRRHRHRTHHHVQQHKVVDPSLKAHVLLNAAINSAADWSRLGWSW